MDAIVGYVQQNRERFLSELFTLLRQPSISAQNVGVAECAALLKRQMEAIGIPARIVPTAGHPVVYGEVQAPGATRTIQGASMRRHATRHVSAVLMATACMAAGAEQRAGGSGDRADVLEEILVTATRREEILQDIAMSVSAFSGEFLKSTGVTQLSTLGQYTPNLKITHPQDVPLAEWYLRECELKNQFGSA